MLKTKNKPLLYAITDEILTPDETIVSQVEKALKAGVDIVQYRNKTKKDEEVVSTCKKLQILCEQYGKIFVVNDRVEVAKFVNSHGLHVGQHDMSLKDIKASYKGIIGSSCYGDICRAKENISLGADYVAFGSFFSSPTKPKSAVVEFDVLENIEDIKMPIAVIGGLNLDNISSFVPYKIDMLCMVSAIFNGNIEKNVTTLKERVSHIF